MGDYEVRERIVKRIARLKSGRPSDYKTAVDGVYEPYIELRPDYRLYVALALSLWTAKAEGTGWVVRVVLSAPSHCLPMMMTVSRSLVILGCSQRKMRTSRLIAAIDRYDGPAFQVLRKHTREASETPLDTYILSGRFGLIPGELLIPRYDRCLASTDHTALRAQVERQFKLALDELQPERLFVSVGSKYWPLLEEPLSREVAPARLVVATGGIGGRASQLAHWLRLSNDVADQTTPEHAPGEAVLLGTTVQLSRIEVLREARKALLADPAAAQRFETWYVAVGRERVAPKWLVSVLFDKPVARFRTADARRVLSLLGVDCIYANRH